MADAKQYAVLRSNRGGKRRFIVAYFTGSTTRGGGPIYQEVKRGLTEVEAYELLKTLRAAQGENPSSKRAERFIGRTIKKLAKKGERGKQAVAIAYTKARRAGFRIPPKKNPGGDVSESAAWKFVADAATAIRRARFGYPKEKVVVDTKDLALGLYRLARQMQSQVRRGLHTNPAIAVLGNPGDAVAGTLSDRVYEVRYRHAQDGKDYKHPFGPGVRATLLTDGRVVLWHPSKRIWKDFA